MTAAIILTLCSLLLIAYVFDLTASKTRIPSVILLLLLGYLMHMAGDFFHIEMPDISGALPVLATVGLILIVLEGSLELEIDRSKIGMVTKSFVGAFLSILVISFIIAFMLQEVSNQPLKIRLLNAIPLAIISSAIAIPSAKHLNPHNREFVVYESSLSDIIGVLFFNFVARNAIFGFEAFAEFGLSILFMTLISLVVTIVLSLFLSKISHHIKFAPIILVVIVIYEIAKLNHLPSLLFILLFGLAMGNMHLLRKKPWMQRFKPDVLAREVTKFKEFTFEGAFIIRVLFFLLFGYLLEASEILDLNTLPFAIVIILVVFLLRALQIWLSKLPILPLLFMAPRGLITILLFLYIEPSQSVAIVNKALITQIIIIGALVMMFGLMFSKRQPAIQKSSPAPENEDPVDVITE